jgi:hypothetical protein
MLKIGRNIYVHTMNAKLFCDQEPQLGGVLAENK